MQIRNLNTNLFLSLAKQILFLNFPVYACGYRYARNKFIINTNNKEEIRYKFSILYFSFANIIYIL